MKSVVEGFGGVEANMRPKLCMCVHVCVCVTPNHFNNLKAFAIIEHLSTAMCVCVCVCWGIIIFTRPPS